MSTSNEFSRFLINLGSRVRSLQNFGHNYTFEQFEKELNTCEAYLLHLYAYADQHQLDLGNYYPQFIDIESSLRNLQYQLEQKRMPWWKKVLVSVFRLVNFVTTWLGLGRYLPINNSPGGLLPP